VTEAPAARLRDLLGLTEDELLATLDADPVAVVSGNLDDRLELPILLDLLAEAEERAGAPVLRRWVRREGPAGRPIDLLTARDFAGFEDALATLAERGFVLRGGG
jgi:hypothetical protein